MSRAVIITSYLEYPMDLPALLHPNDYIICLDGGYDIAQSLAITPDLLLGDFDSIRTQIPEGAVKILRYPPEKDYTDLELAFRILDPVKTPDLLVIGGLGGRLDQTLVNIQMLMRYTALPAEVLRSEDADAASDCAAGCGVTDDAPGKELRAPEKTPRAPGSETDAPNYGSPRKYRRIELMDGHHHCFVVHGDGDMPSGEADPDLIRASSEAGFTANGPVVYRIPREPHSYLSLLPLTGECSGVDLDGVKYPLKNAVLRRGESLSISNEFQAEQALLQLRHGSLLVVVTKQDPGSRQ